MTTEVTKDRAMLRLIYAAWHISWIIAVLVGLAIGPDWLLRSIVGIHFAGYSLSLLLNVLEGKGPILK